MDPIDIVIKNYRCFGDADPCRISLGNEFTALVGPNNSGKSSLLKLFRELRPLWSSLSSQTYIQNGLNQGELAANVEHVQDPTEIFCDLNSRPLEISISLRGDVADDELSEVHIYSDRGRPGYWRPRFSKGRDPTILGPINGQAWGAGGDNSAQLGNSRVRFQRMSDVFRTLASSFYIGPFRNAINVGATTYYDVSIGDAFIGAWDKWKTGAIKSQNHDITRVTEDIRRIFGFEQLDIAASQPLKTLALTIDKKPYKLSEVGAGLAQFIVVFGNALILKPSLILIDEPELNLHPSLQIDFLTSLGSYATDAVIFATHSIGLARSVGDHIYSSQRVDGLSHLRIFEQTASYAEFLGEMSFSAIRELGSEGILLVEGVTDIKTVQQLLRKCNADHRIVVLSLGGNSLARGNVSYELAELKRICPKISALVDSERKSESAEAIQQRTDFAATCKELGFKVLVTERRAIENYFTDDAVKAALGDRYSALAPYQRLNDAPVGWSKAINWKIARALNWSDVKDTDLGRFLAAL